MEDQDFGAATCSGKHDIVLGGFRNYLLTSHPVLSCDACNKLSVWYILVYRYSLVIYYYYNNWYIIIHQYIHAISCRMLKYLHVLLRCWGMPLR